MFSNPRIGTLVHRNGLLIDEAHELDPRLERAASRFLEDSSFRPVHASLLAMAVRGVERITAVFTAARS